MSFIRAQIDYMNSVSGAKATTLPDAIIAYYDVLSEDGMPATAVDVAAGDNDLDGGTLQEVIQDIYDILATKADAG